MKEKKRFVVTIELEAFEVTIMARNKTEAKKKALARLARKNPVSLIRWSWPLRAGRITKRREIDVDEWWF